MSEFQASPASSASADSEALKAEAAKFAQAYAATQAEVGKVMVGMDKVVEALLVGLFAGGNVLMEGVPGLGKTELVKTLSKALSLQFQRIQFTPDLMPADIIGTSIMQQDENGQVSLSFREGPVFTQLLLADEINRATPKTQSALLETMQEHTVTAGGQTYKLDQPYLVLATQNPLEQEGTFPLPEAQLDRFLLKVNVPFLSRDELNEVVSRTLLKPAIDLQPILNADGILELRKILNHVVVAKPMQDYAVRLVLASHPDTENATDAVRRFVQWGASPRAAQALIRAGRVRALAAGRPHLSFEDIKHFAHEVLQHRMLLNYDGQAEEVQVTDIIDDIIKNTPETV